jgi:NitT/TauT family transport system substrate-binding protein
MKKTAIYQLLPTFIVGVLMCAAGMFWSSSEDKKSFTVAVNIWPGMEAMLMASQSKRLQTERINFVEMSWSSAATGAFRLRVADAAIVTLDELLRLEDDGARPRAVLILGISVGSDTILGRPGLKSISDLRGKRVGVELRSSGEHLLLHALTKNDMSMKDIQVVPLNQAETETAYDDTDLDVVVTADPWSTRLRDKGAVVLYDSKAVGLELSRVLVVSEDSLKMYSKEVQTLVSSHLKHVLKSGEMDAGSAGLDVMLRRENLTPDQWHRAVELIHAPDAEENLRLMNPAGGGLVKCLKKMAEDMRRNGLLTHEFKIEPLLNSTFVERSRS